MAFGSSTLYSALNVSGITSLLPAYGAGKALFSDPYIPQEFNGSTSINFYMSAPFFDAWDYQTYQYSISCRAKTDGESKTLADAVMTAINRSNDSDYYIICSVLQTIPPLDSSDNYNTPIEATIKKR